MRRANMIVENAKKLNCDRFVTSADIVNVSNLFDFKWDINNIYRATLSSILLLWQIFSTNILA